jgi:hypothetical protein
MLVSDSLRSRIALKISSLSRLAVVHTMSSSFTVSTFPKMLLHVLPVGPSLFERIDKGEQVPRHSLYLPRLAGLLYDYSS